MKIIIYSLLLSLLPFVSQAGDKEGKSENFIATKSISGTITDIYGETIPAAKIVIKETGEEVFANFEGRFSFTLPANKNYHLVLESIGFQAVECLSSELGSNSTLSLKFL